MSRIGRSVLALVACAGPLGTTTIAGADGPVANPQIAQALFDDARALMEAKRYAEACPKFADSHRLEPAGGTLLNLALCHELEGKTATAWGEFREALSVASRDDRRDRQDLAEVHIRALEPRLMRLTVVVTARVAARDPEITFDRSPLPSGAWNTAIPVDPGEHRIVMTAQGLRRWEASVVTAEVSRGYRVEVPLVEGLPGDACPPGTVPEGPACVGLPGPHRRSMAFWIFLGGAGVSIATSAVTGVMALSANAYVKDNCSAERSFCRVADADDEATRARTLAWVSTAALAVGAGAGIVAFALPREKTSPVTATAAIRAQNGATFATVDITPLHW